MAPKFRGPRARPGAKAGLGEGGDGAQTHRRLSPHPPTAGQWSDRNPRRPRAEPVIARHRPFGDLDSRRPAPRRRARRRHARPRSGGRQGAPVAASLLPRVVRAFPSDTEAAGDRPVRDSTGARERVAGRRPPIPFTMSQPSSAILAPPDWKRPRGRDRYPAPDARVGARCGGRGPSPRVVRARPHGGRLASSSGDDRGWLAALPVNGGSGGGR